MDETFMKARAYLAQTILTRNCPLQTCAIILVLAAPIFPHFLNRRPV